MLAGFAALAAALTFPLVFHLGSLGYKSNQVGDAQYSIWNVAWVAHALLTDPRHVLDANIFYPYSSALIFSEANLVAGALAVPVYWWTNNPFAAHNSVVLLSFALSGLGTYYLVRHLVGDRRAAAIAGVCFAFCPYVYGHLLHIQLLMTAGIPFSLLAYHRLAERPTFGRGVALGLAMGIQGLACAYYAVFVVLLIGYAALFTAVAQRLWRTPAYWRSLLVAAGVSLAIVLPLFARYLLLQQNTGFVRELHESNSFSATWVSYLTTSSYASAWIYEWLREQFNVAPFTDQIFPGLFTTLFGLGGAIAGWKAGGRMRYVAALYGSIIALAFWESFGPSGGLYRITYALPGFTFLRAPSRFGLIVVLGLAVLTGIALSELFPRVRMPRLIAALLLVTKIVSQATPIPLTPIDPIEPAYYVLARQPDGALLEMPPRSHSFNFSRTQYMINSTVHWKPLVNAYSDFLPASLYDSLDVLAAFPSRESFTLLERDRVRYVTFDLREYYDPPERDLRDELTASLREFAPYLKQLYADDHIWLYEIVGYPQ